MYSDIMDTIGFVSGKDKEVGEAMALELGRQRRNLELIASENIVSPAVMAAMRLCSHPINTPRDIPERDITADVNSWM